VALYRPGSEKPAWSQPLLTGRHWLGLLLADDERLLALPSAGGLELAMLFRTSDGKHLGDIPRPTQASGLNHVLPMAFDPAGKRLALDLPDRLLLLDVPSGRVLREEPIKGRNYFAFVGGLRSGWIVSGSDYTRFFDEAKGWGAEVAGFREANAVRDLDTAAGRRLLLRNSYGRARLVDPATGKVVRRWIAADRQPTLPRELPQGGEVAAGRGATPR